VNEKSEYHMKKMKSGKPWEEACDEDADRVRIVSGVYECRKDGLRYCRDILLPPDANVFAKIMNGDSNGVSVSHDTDEMADIRVNLQVRASDDPKKPTATGPLFGSVIPAKMTDAGTTWAKFWPLLDNYTMQAGKNESYTLDERAEISEFLDVALETKPLREVFLWATRAPRHGGLGIPLTLDTFRRDIESMWFEIHAIPFESKGVAKVQYGCAFEHVFVGEGMYAKHAMQNFSSQFNKDLKVRLIDLKPSHHATRICDMCTKRGTSWTFKDEKAKFDCCSACYKRTVRTGRKEVLDPKLMGFHYFAKLHRDEQSGKIRYVGHRYGKKKQAQYLITSPYCTCVRFEYKLPVGVSGVFAKDCPGTSSAASSNISNAARASALRQNTLQKREGSIFLGMSPEAVIALGAACFYLSYNGHWRRMAHEAGQDAEYAKHDNHMMRVWFRFKSRRPGAQYEYMAVKFMRFRRFITSIFPGALIPPPDPATKKGRKKPKPPKKKRKKKKDQNKHGKKEDPGGKGHGPA